MRRQIYFSAAITIFTLCMCANMALGVDATNAVNTGNWMNSSTWDTAIPDLTYDAQVDNGLTVTINSGETVSAYRVKLGNNTGHTTGTLTMNGGKLSTDRAIILGGINGSNGTGVLNQSNGDIYIGEVDTGGHLSLFLGNRGTSQGFYNLSGGSISVPHRITVGFYEPTFGELHQTGGQISTSLLEIGRMGTGTCSLEDGSITVSAGSEFAGDTLLGMDSTGNGTMTQSGGSLSTVDLTIADQGNALYSMTGGTLLVANDIWLANRGESTGTYSLSGNTSVDVANNLNVCAAVGSDGSSEPNGASGTMNIVGEDVAIIVGGNLVATGGSVVDPEEVWVNSSIFNFTTGATGDVSTISVSGTADIDYAVFDIFEGGAVAPGTVLDLVTTVGGISNFATASLGPNATSLGDWTLQLGGTSNEILQAVKAVTIPGDTNGDKIVDETDATMVASNWGAPVTGGPAEGDFNSDGVVDATDASIMAGNWGNHNISESTSVPEPSAVVLLLGMLLGVVVTRQKDY